jgi:hypothetical protein
MFQFDGKEFEKLALHGGGSPMIGQYLSFFEDAGLFADFKSFNVPIITSSAASLTFMVLLAASLYPEDCASPKKIISELFTWFHLQLENVIESSDQTSIMSIACIENILREHLPVALFTLTFADLTVINPKLEWTVNCSVFETCFVSRTLGTHTPDVLVWQACIASASVPVVFSGLEIHGELLFDGDFSNWTFECSTAEVLHVAPCNGGAAKIFDLRSEITLLDEAVKFIGQCFTHIVAKPKIKSLYEVPFAATLTANPLAEEFLAAGKKMAEMFILK